MEDLDLLMEVGMTKAESKIYLTLLKFGPLTAGKIVTLSHQHISVTYAALQRLIEKGYITYTKKGKFNEYFATDPEILLNKLRTTVLNLEEKLPRWKRYAMFAKGSTSVEIFEGIKGIKTMYNQLLKDAKRGDKYRVFSHGREIENPEMISLIKQVAARRVKLGIHTKILADKIAKKIFSKQEQDFIKSVNLRFSNFKFPQGVIIFKDNIVFMSWERDPKAIMIKDTRLANQYARFFDEIYETGEPYKQRLK